MTGSEQKANLLVSLMALRSRRVTIINLLGVAGTVEVTASSAFETVAKALTAIGHKPMLRPDGLQPVKVRVLDMPVDYEVWLRDFTKWLERRGNSPREVMDRKRIRAILQLPKL